MTNSKQQTAVDFAVEKLSAFIQGNDLAISLIKHQAKETEKERMIQFACDVFDKNYKSDASFKDTAKHLYQQTYGDNK